jgi:hypothetical protein
MQFPLATAKQKPTPYASPEDFCRIFQEGMTNLYLLALMLTADGPKAEQCFVSGLEDSSKGNTVFKEWARSWARLTIVQNAIRLIHPRPMGEDPGASAVPVDRNEQVVWRKRTELSAILELPAFERFVFVMSVLHGYSDQDCSILLGCTRRDILAARTWVGRMPEFVESRSQAAQESAGADELLYCKTGSSRQVARI